MACMYIKANQQHTPINMQHDDILFLIVACFQAAKLAVPALIVGYIAYKLAE
jgi:hypothetical protein